MESHQHERIVRADDGEDIHVWCHGQGPRTLVLLHGSTSSHLEWSPFIHRLETEYRVVRWDARAHGGHPRRSPQGASAPRMARDLANLIEALDLAGACFVGHSMGALTLWQYIRDFGTGALGALGFIDQSPRLLTDEDWDLGIYGDFDRARATAFAAELRADFPEAVLRLAARGLNAGARAGYAANGRGWQRTREALAQLPAAGLIECWEDLIELDLRPVISAIDRPVLLVYGGRSNFYPLGITEWLCARLPQARLSIHVKGNHSPHLMDPTRFLAELMDFFPPGDPPLSPSAAPA